MHTLKLGYIPLTDSLPLVVARECGFFAAEQLDVELIAQPSWANIRDKLVVGHIDAAHMLAPMLLASTLGIGGLRKPMMTAFALGLNGNAITVSNALFRDLKPYGNGDDSAIHAARALSRLVRERASQGLPKLVFASVFPYSCHHYQLRYWMQAGGIDPDRDVQLVVLPPTQMVDNLKLQHIDGFCVGEPWNTVAAAQGVGHCLVSGYGIWQNAAEKMLAVTCDWHQQYPERHAALLRALLRAAQWCEAHQSDALSMLCSPVYLDLPEAWVRPALEGQLICGLGEQPAPAEAFHVWHRYQANFPWRSSGDWLLSQMQYWHRVPPMESPADIVDRVFRADIYRDTLSGLVPVPQCDRKPMGVHQSEWPMEGQPDITLGPDLLLDGRCC